MAVAIISVTTAVIVAIAGMARSYRYFESTSCHLSDTANTSSDHRPLLAEYGWR